MANGASGNEIAITGYNCQVTGKSVPCTAKKVSSRLP